MAGYKLWDDWVHGSKRDKMNATRTPWSWYAGLWVASLNDMEAEIFDC